MKLPKILKNNCNSDPKIAGTPASILLTCCCEVVPDVVRTYAQLRALATLPSGVTLPPIENKLEERVQIGEPITFAPTGNGWTRYDIVINSGRYGAASVGEAQFLAFNGEMEFTFQGTEAEVLGFADFIANRPLMGLMGDVGDTSGDMTLLGQKNFPIFATDIKVESGSKAGDKRACTFKLSDMSGAMIKKYNIVTLHPSGLPIAA